MRLVFDLEANGLYEKADTIWCIVAKDIDSGKIYEWTVESEQQSATGFCTEVLQNTSELIGHNILNYDIPLLKKLINWEPSNDTRITDTLVLSRLFNPDRLRPYGSTGKSGPHSLDSWGYRCGRGKPSHDEWDKFSEEMLHRCREDVEINVLTYHLLQGESRDHDWGEAIELEHEMARLITKQEHHGIRFDEQQARNYIVWLTERIEEIDAMIVPQLPAELKKIGTVPINNPFLKTGGYRKQTQEYLDEAYPSIKKKHLVGGPFNRIRFVPFDLGSIAKVKDYLLESGWKPDNWNISKTTGEKTSPKMEGSFEGVSGEIPIKVKERITWRHRRSQIEGWLGNLREDGRLSAGANPNGTNTGRMRHHTVVNIPKANADKKTGELIWDTDKQKDTFGTQMRSLFIPSEGYDLVGHDASGLELRMLAHFMDDEEFTNQILTGDIHEYNQRKAGLPNRDAAKTFILQ